MTEKLPPLPSLAGRGSQRCDQETLERVIRSVYGQRPDLIAKILERETLGADPDNKIAKEFRKFTREKENIAKGVMANKIFFEMRRCVRHMYGIPDSYLPNEQMPKA
jgi:hypothetical protein